MKFMFAEAVAIVKALSDYKERFESMHETREEDGEEMRWVFIEENLNEEDAIQYKSLKKLISKFTTSEL